MTISLAVKGTACLLQGVALYSTVQDLRGNYKPQLKLIGKSENHISELETLASSKASSIFGKNQKHFKIYLESTNDQWATCAMGTSFGPASIAMDAVTVANNLPLAEFWLTHSVAVICSNAALKVRAIGFIVFIATVILLSPTLPVASYAIAYGLESLVAKGFDRWFNLSAFEKAVARSTDEQLTQAQAYLRLQQKSGKSEISYLDAKLRLVEAEIQKKGIQTNDQG